MTYDFVAIFAAETDPKAGEDKLKTLAQKDGFSLSEVNVWGKKHLAYPIKKKSEGMYIASTLSGSTKVASLLSRIKVEEDILRTLIVKKAKVSKKAVKKGSA